MSYPIKEMRITRAEVEHVAWLARLGLAEDEKEEFTRQLNKILEHMDKLRELDTEGVAPTFHVLPLQNVFRPDEVGQPLPRDQVLGNAPDRAGGCFKVPRVIED